MRNKLRKASPSIITSISLISGMASIALSLEGYLGIAATLILASYLLDLVDGAVARKLGATSDFGVQLDSLVDMTNFGAASTVLVWSHLRMGGNQSWLIWPFGIAFVLAGGLRLARFNLQATDMKAKESTGLTISTSGAYVALAVLADRTFEISLLPDLVFLILLPLLAFLMVSTIRFPELKTIFGRRRFSIALLSASVIVAFWATPQVVWWGLTTGYITFGILRAGVRTIL
jgi:CDP-diacylglycerol--serine O-phosphatidyltransferase